MRKTEKVLRAEIASLKQQVRHTSDPPLPAPIFVISEEQLKRLEDLYSRYDQEQKRHDKEVGSLRNNLLESMTNIQGALWQVRTQKKLKRFVASPGNLSIVYEKD